MTKFTVTLNEDSESYFKIAIKAFDQNSKVSYDDKDNVYYVETKLSIEDLKSLTSVKSVVDNTQYKYKYDDNTYNAYDPSHYLKYLDM